jgi:serine/threonine protein kinase
MAGRVGQRFGDYRLVRFLGDGTFGDVYLGEQVYDKSPAAVKVFKTKLTPDRFKDFLNEVRTVLLKHPHIVQVLDFGMREDDIPFLVMEFAPNGTLLARHPRGTLLPLSTIVQYVKQIAAALQYAHDQRRIHRDIKPENILFGAKNELLLSDFGIAAVAHSTSSQKMEEAIGTALYMAPEQWKGKPLPASDQYALGIVVYEWLSGKCPFAGAGLQLMYQHLEAPPPPIRTKVPTLSPEVEEVILTALAKDPKTRFGSVQAFATALQEAGTAPQQATIYPPAQPGRTSIPPTVPVRPVSGEAVVAESVVTPPIPPITQPESLPLPPHPQTDPVLFPPPGYPAAEVATPALPYPKTPAANPISPQKKLAKRGISRRVVMRIGFAVAGVAVVGVGGVTLLLNKTSHLQIGALLATYTGHSNLVTAVSWSPNGQLIASGSSDDSVQVWRTEG